MNVKNMNVLALRAMARREKLLPSLVLLALAVTLPFADFYLANVVEAPSIARLAKMLMQYFGLLIGLSLLLRVILYKLVLWRIVVTICVVTVLFFSYAEIRSLVVGVLPGFPVRDLAIYFVWLLLPVAVGMYLIAGNTKSSGITMAMLAMLLVFSLVRIATKLEFSEKLEIAAAADVSSANVFSPNVYWIILDGYPGENILKSEFHFDNSDFYSALDERDFFVVPGSRSNHPSSIYSVANTLSMGYVLTDKSSSGQAKDLASLRRITRGGSRVVGQFRKYGYKYVHFANGYDYMTLCDDQADKCVEGNKGFDELSITVLKRTPIIDYLMINTGKTEKIDTPSFDWGGVDDLNMMLSDIFAVQSPYFVYAHIISPHPPIRFNADCSKRAFYPDLVSWKREVKGDFIEQLKCANQRITGVIDRIVDENPDAIIILQADHGSAFSGQFKTDPARWTKQQFEERFSVLNALRLPEKCKSKIISGASLVNTFPVVFACVTGSDVNYIEDRYFISVYDDSPLFGKLVEYTPDRPL